MQNAIFMKKKQKQKKMLCKINEKNNREKKTHV